MTPEAADYLDQAMRTLVGAEGVLAAGFPEVAAREAYLSALNAARAIIFENTGRVAKTYSGVRTVMARLIHEGLRFDSELAGFLAKGFEIKTEVDYGRRILTEEDMKRAMERARMFVAAAKSLLEGVD